MNKDEIRELAQEAGFMWGYIKEEGLVDGMTAFAKLVAEHEREACAKLAMTISEQGLPEEMPEGDELIRACEQIAGGVLIADAIRSRGQE